MKRYASLVLLLCTLGATAHTFGAATQERFSITVPAPADLLARLKPALAAYRGEARFGWWVRAHHNWNQVCNGGIAIGALALADVEPELAGEILVSGLTSIQRPSMHFAPDGAWAEGPGYWNYATAYHVYYLAALRSALGTDFGLAKAPGFDKTGLFPLYVTGPSRRTFNFADASAGTIRAPQLFWFARTFNLPEAPRASRQQGRPQARHTPHGRQNDTAGRAVPSPR